MTQPTPITSLGMKPAPQSVRDVVAKWNAQASKHQDAPRASCVEVQRPNGLKPIVCVSLTMSGQSPRTQSLGAIDAKTVRAALRYLWHVATGEPADSKPSFEW